jgi:hypothetical protein
MFDNQFGIVEENLVASTTQQLDILYSKNDDLSQQNLIDYVEKDLALLENDWDGYGACAIDENVIEHTLFIFNQLPNAFLKNINKEDILPTPNGTISIEWNNGFNELLLEIGKNISTYYIQCQGHTAKINNQFNILDTKQMQTFIEELKHYFFDKP